VFDLAALSRLVMVGVFAGYVVRDILRPDRDVVRQTYDGQDPDGGVLNDEYDEEFDPPDPASHEPALAG
jgi:hypothetical protein